MNKLNSPFELEPPSIVFYSISVSSQTGSLKGKVTDADTGEPIPFANVVAERDGQMVGGASTDFDGNYIIKGLQAGKFDLKRISMMIPKMPERSGQVTP